MIEEVYRNSFKEVYYILQNSEDELLEKIPLKFMDFLKTNMNIDYKTNVSLELPLTEQNLLEETNDILSLVFRSYLATDEEKKEFAIKDNSELIAKKQNKIAEYQEKDIYKIFEKKQNIDNIKIDNNLIVTKKANFIQRFFNKILNLFNNEHKWGS